MDGYPEVSHEKNTVSSIESNMYCNSGCNIFFGKDIGISLLPDVTGEIRTQSKIIEQKLESSQRLEVTTVDEEGLLKADTNVIILGTVGSTTIRM